MINTIYASMVQMHITGRGRDNMNLKKFNVVFSVIILAAIALLIGCEPAKTNKKEDKSMSKLDHSEIISVGGVVGTRLKDAALSYSMEYLYENEMPIFLDEYTYHSHSDWGWNGEQPGKWLEAMANYKWLNNPQIDSAIEDVVSQLAASQTKENKKKTGYNQFGGYLGNATEEIRNSTPIKGMDAYEMYSLINGLVNVYKVYKDDNSKLANQALDCVVKLADYIVATIGDENTKVCYKNGRKSDVYKMEFWPLANINGTTIAGHDVHQGWEGALLIDSMMLLSGTVKEVDGLEKKSEKYSQWVDWVIDSIDKWASSYMGYGDTPYKDLDKVATGEMGVHELQHYVHSHTFQMTFMGLLKKYQETGDETYLNKVVGAWEDIVNRQMYITGTTSVGEHFTAGNNLPNVGSVCETCSTNSWTSLNSMLFEISQDEKYQDVIETILFNHMFATSTIDSDGYSYHRPLNGSTERFYVASSCCSSSGLRMQSFVPYYIYSKTNDSVYLNQFIESQVAISLSNGMKMNLKQVTQYPTGDEVYIDVLEGTTADTLYIRIPQWVKNPVIKVNGKEVSGLTAGSYKKINVKEGDKIVLVYASVPEWVEGDKSNEGLWTIKEGPMVYCLHSAYMTEAESEQAYGMKVAQVSASGVIDAEDGTPVKISRTVTFADQKYFGNCYMVEMLTPNGKQELAVVPYANIGQWYRYGEEAPGKYGYGYANSVKYPYAVWIMESVTSYPQVPEEQNEPVVHYDFNQIEDNVIKDISGNGKDATYVGKVVIENGRIDNCMYLNGYSYVKLPEDVIYGLYNMSISVWVNSDEARQWARIVDFGNPGEALPYPNLFLTTSSDTGRIRLAYEDGTNSHLNGKALKLNEWVHMTVTIEGTKAVLYINGEKVSENSNFNMLPMVISKMTSNYIGKSNYGQDPLFKGYIDDFRIYNRVLEENEIIALASGEEPQRNIQTIEQPDIVETAVNVMPILPQYIKVTYENGRYGLETVVWESVTEDMYSKKGSFEVSGSVRGRKVQITVNVN